MSEPKKRYGRLGDCERCTEPAVAFNDDGVALCEDCIFMEAVEEVLPKIIAGEDV
jgi:hypothetical protein